MGQPNQKTIFIGEEELNSKLVFDFSHNPQAFKLTLSETTIQKIQKCHSYILDIANKNEKVVYGVNTGFGALSETPINSKDLNDLQYNILRSHSIGVGKPFDPEYIRSMMLLRAHSLAQGHSGISLEIVQRLIDFLNFDILPVVPRKGSVGASGDLAPLSHLSLPLIGEGEVIHAGETFPTQKILEKFDLKPVSLHPKAGLALINGTTAMLSLCLEAVERSKYIMSLADLVAAMTIDSIKGSIRPFSPLIANRKPHAGQIEVAENITALLKESPILAGHKNCGKVQDPYSLRCVSQVHGACRESLKHVNKICNTELNAVTDNPLIFPDEDEVISGGNFHGEILALGMDYLAMALAEIASISERRIEKILNPSFSGLPIFLAKNPGKDSGLMIAQVTAAALVSENKGLCHPASVDSIPNQNDKEDHVSMGLGAGLKLHQVIENVEYVLACELLCSSTAMDFEKELSSAPIIDKAMKEIRKVVPHIDDDRIFAPDLENLFHLVKNRNFDISGIQNTVF